MFILGLKFLTRLFLFPSLCTLSSFAFIVELWVIYYVSVLPLALSFLSLCLSLQGFAYECNLNFQFNTFYSAEIAFSSQNQPLSTFEFILLKISPFCVYSPLL